MIEQGSRVPRSLRFVQGAGACTAPPLSRMLNREPQPYGLSHRDQRGEPGVSTTRQSAIQTLAFNARSFGHLGDAP